MAEPPPPPGTPEIPPRHDGPQDDGPQDDGPQDEGPQDEGPGAAAAGPAIVAVLETVLYVADLERAAAFYEEVLGLGLLHADARMRAFDVGGRGTLLLFPRGGTLRPVETPGGTIPPHDGSGPLHVAFSVPGDSLAAWRARLGATGIAIESEVRWPRGGTSLYFRDPDGHCLELATPGLWKGY